MAGCVRFPAPLWSPQSILKTSIWWTVDRLMLLAQKRQPSSFNSGQQRKLFQLCNLHLHSSYLVTSVLVAVQKNAMHAKLWRCGGPDGK